MKSILSKCICCLLMGLTISITATSTKAQLSETQTLDYVPVDSFLVVSLNMKSLFEGMDTEHPIIKQYLERDSSKNAFEFDRMAQQLTFLTSATGEEENQYSFPGGSITRFNDSLDPQEWLKKSEMQQPFAKLEFETEKYKEHELHIGTFDFGEGVVVGTEGMAFVFPNEETVISASESVLKGMLDQYEGDKSSELASKLDSEVDVHFLMGSGSKLTEIPMFDLVAGGIPIPDLRETLESIESIELIGDMDQMTPVTGTVVCNSTEAAIKLEELLKTGLQAVPALVMLGESQVDEVSDFGEIFEPMKEDIRSLLKLADTAAKEISITRNDQTLEIQLGNVEGLDQLPNKLIVLMFGQQMAMEKMMEEARGTGFVD